MVLQNNPSGITSLHDQALDELADRFSKASLETEEKPADWMEKYYWIPTPRDVTTGEDLPSGPIQLALHQKDIINEALSLDSKGKFRYSTVIYSAPKKSGKSAIASGVALYLAKKIPYAQIYCVANDGRSSNDRLFIPVWRCLNHHNQNSGELQAPRLLLTEAYLDNYSHIRPIPVDAAGEAGSEPTAILYSEVWGFIEEKKRRLFTEMTIPPTLWGRAIRWIESYAGYVGVSDLLYELYQLAVKEGTPHPAFEHMRGRTGEPVVWVNKEAHLFAYWDTLPRMPWQLGEEGEAYYKQEAKLLSDSEFRRIHQNEWVSPVGVFVDPALWNSCADKSIPSLQEGSKTPMVMAVDAALTGDTASIVLVSRHPTNPEIEIAVRYCKIFKALPGRPIQIERDLGREIRRLCGLYNVVCVVYDKYQMEGMVQSYRRGEVAFPIDELESIPEDERLQYMKQQSEYAQRWYYDFNQQSRRNVSDKALLDAIMARQIRWNPNDTDSQIAESGNEESLAKHIKQAGKTETGGKLRIEKLAEDAKVDAAVALSMAHYQCRILNIGNGELHPEELVQQLDRGEISAQQFLKQLEAVRLSRRIQDG